jgi:ribosomal protein S12 methylthiotransferase accessory factor
MGRNEESLRAALGVSRVARVTGLDRTGVEVACAVRPGGHVLQATNGKGESWRAACASALGEAAELWAAERADARELRGGPGGCLHVAGRDLATGEPAWVPAGAVFCPPAGAPLLGDAGVPWTTNGMGAHARRAAAVLHALLEAVERDQLARALPDGFTVRAVRERLLDRASVERAAPAAAALASRVEARGFRVFFLDGAANVGLATVAALLFDEGGGPLPLAAGYACRLDPAAALHAALLEAAQSRATDVHGAREDVAAQDRAAAAALRRWCERARARRSVRDLPRARGGIPVALARLRRAGFPRAIAVDLAAAPLHVVKVIVPGMRVSELL